MSQQLDHAYLNIDLKFIPSDEIVYISFGFSLLQCHNGFCLPFYSVTLQSKGVNLPSLATGEKHDYPVKREKEETVFILMS